MYVARALGVVSGQWDALQQISCTPALGAAWVAAVVHLIPLEETDEDSHVAKTAACLRAMHGALGRGPGVLHGNVHVTAAVLASAPRVLTALCAAVARHPSETLAYADGIAWALTRDRGAAADIGFPLVMGVLYARAARLCISCMGWHLTYIHMHFLYGLSYGICICCMGCHLTYANAYASRDRRYAIASWTPDATSGGSARSALSTLCHACDEYPDLAVVVEAPRRLLAFLASQVSAPRFCLVCFDSCIFRSDSI